MNVVLIDADWVDPEQLRFFHTKVHEKCKQLLGDIEVRVFSNDDLLRLLMCAPRVRQSLVWWSLLQGMLFELYLDLLFRIDYALSNHLE